VDDLTRATMERKGFVFCLVETLFDLFVVICFVDIEVGKSALEFVCLRLNLIYSLDLITIFFFYDFDRFKFFLVLFEAFF